MTVFKTLKYITSHPFNRGRRLTALCRFGVWQLRSRLQKKVTFKWIQGSKLIVRRGMTGATGNIYCGLHEYVDMSFLLHFLRPGDLFLDVGANIGSFTVLASKVCKAKTIAIEPDKNTAAHLERNVVENEIQDLVRIELTAVGAKPGFVNFSLGKDTTNQVLPSDSDAVGQVVPLHRIDDILGGDCPVFIKIDVEGYESEALKGAEILLKDKRLLAIEIETVDDFVSRVLHQNGFRQFGYDPDTRRLIEPDIVASNNALFLRDQSAVQRILDAAITRKYRGRTI